LNENFEKIEMIFRNKNHSRSKNLKNLIMSKLIYQQNDDKISFKKNEMFNNIIFEFVVNQSKRKNESEKI
jgi:hypothetical protein